MPARFDEGVRSGTARGDRFGSRRGAFCRTAAFYASVLSYREAALGIRGIVDDHANSGLAALIDQQAGASFGGLWVKDSSERIEEDRWIHTLALTVGLVRPV